MGFKILVINPGSTSTKCAIYDNATEAWKKGVTHKAEDLARFQRLMDQYEFRSQQVRESMKQAPVPLSELAAVVGRGGLLKPIPGGVYEVNDRMKSDLLSCRYGTHASNFGALIADSIAAELGLKAYIVDPVVVDELDTMARLSGVPEVPRRSIFHALNQKATAKKAARALGRRYDECTMIVAHMGGGISIGIHVNGRVVDVNNALDGEGPFAIERAGTVPAGDWMRWVLAHQHDPESLQRMITGKGGLVAYLGTNEFPAIEKAAEGQGDDQGRLPQALCDELIRSLCYQISRSIAGLAAYTSGRVDAIVLTGGLAFSNRVVQDITRRVKFLGPVMIYPGENELEALAVGACEVLAGETTAKIYEG